MKTYKFELTEADNGITFTRTNNGFNVLELLGILKLTENSIMEQLKGISEEKIDTIKLQLVEEEAGM